VSRDRDPNARWTEYYQAVGTRPAREFYRQAVARFEEPGTAVDLGCGAGVETRDLLARGWRVHAIDREAAAFEPWVRDLPADQRARLETTVAAMEELEVPAADLVWAGLSLPFCRPDRFARLWSRIVGALHPGGRFAGDLFGVRHAWAGNPAMTFHERAQVERLADGLQREYVQEGEGECLTALDGLQPWHVFSLCVRKQG
jgi:tellurite methyltransferase